MSVNIFYSYAYEDKILRNELEKHLSALKRESQITDWYDRDIQAGMEWEREINQHLNTADIILLLISSDFLASDYCYSVEMHRALERHNSGEARIIPIILRPVVWENTPIGQFQVLPTNGVPVTGWADRDEAFKDVVLGIERVSTKVFFDKRNKQLIEEGKALYYAGRYDEALRYFRSAIGRNYADLRNYDMFFHYNLGDDYEKQNNTLPTLGCDIRFIWSDADLLTKLGSILWHKGHSHNALIAYEQAIMINPNNSQAHIGKGLVLESLGRSHEAELCFKKAQEII